MDRAIAILIAEPNYAKALEIVSAFLNDGQSDMALATALSEIATVLKREDHDVTHIDLASPNRDTLENLSLLSDAKSRPGAMFVDHTDETRTQATTAAGVDARVVNGL